jgi:hypothetical protein
MRRKQTEAIPTGAGAGAASGNGGVELPGKHGSEPSILKVAAHIASLSPAIIEAAGEGVIDLDPERPTMVPTDQTTNPAERNVLQPSQKAKRKYTKRAKTTSTAVTPTFIDRDGLRDARIKVFTDYIDGKCEFSRAAEVDQQLRELDKMAETLNKTFSIQK